MLEIKATYRNEDGSREERLLRPWQRDYWEALYLTAKEGSWRRR